VQRSRGAAGAAAVLALVVASGAAADPVVLLESAALGTTGLSGGTSLTDKQLVGWRFEVGETLQVSEVGGHLLGGCGRRKQEENGQEGAQQARG